MAHEESFLVGKKQNNTIENPVTISRDDMNDFCVGWLAIFNPSTLNFDEE